MTSTADKLDALRQARADADAARANLDALIRNTAADRMSVDRDRTTALTINTIADAAGLSRQRIYQILDGK
jgi:hypothetical protein